MTINYTHRTPQGHKATRPAFCALTTKMANLTLSVDQDFAPSLQSLTSWSPALRPWFS